MAKIILTHEVSGLGAVGDVVEVKNGYARNYLLPRNFALPWSKGSEKQLALVKANRRNQIAATLEEAENHKKDLESKTIKIVLKTGANGRLFGTVKNDDVVAAVAKAGLGELDKRKVEIATHIKSIGIYDAKVRLHESVSANLKIEVISE